MFFAKTGKKLKLLPDRDSNCLSSEDAYSFMECSEEQNLNRNSRMALANTTKSVFYDDEEFLRRVAGTEVQTETMTDGLSSTPVEV